MTLKLHPYFVLMVIKGVYRKMQFIRGGGAQSSTDSDPDVNQGLRGRKLTFKLGL